MLNYEINWPKRLVRIREEPLSSFEVCTSMHGVYGAYTGQTSMLIHLSQVATEIGACVRSAFHEGLCSLLSRPSAIFNMHIFHPAHNRLGALFCLVLHSGMKPIESFYDLT